MPAGGRACGVVPAALRLPTGEVHVWTVPVATDGRILGELERELTPAERAWTGQLRDPGTRARFVVTRAALRALLGAYLGRSPRRIALAAGPHGKPELRGRGGAAPLHFSVSHSAALALLAFSVDGPVGVDLERVRELRDPLGLADRFLARGESGELQAVAGPGRSRAFLSLWTAKEAVLKARGDGLAGLERVEIERRGRGLAGIEDGEARWVIRSFAPARGYLGALAVPAPPGRRRPGSRAVRGTGSPGLG